MVIITTIDILLGIGITVGFAFALMKMTGATFEMFFIYMIIISAILIYVGVFPEWVMGLDLIVIAVLIYQRWTK